MSNEQDNKRPKEEPHAFSEEERKLVAGIYRRLGELTDALRAISAKPAAKPTQQDLPGIAPHDTADLPDGLVWTNEGYHPGEIAKKIAAEPPKWGNAVKFYQVLWCKCGCCTFDLAELVENGAIREAIRQETNGKIGVASFSRVLSTLHRAGAVGKVGRKGYAANPPTPEILAAIERTARKRKEVAA